MIKKINKKLQLNKETISKLSQEKIVGGVERPTPTQIFTAGCSDGCSMFKTMFNCTKDACSVDCWTPTCQC